MNFDFAVYNVKCLNGYDEPYTPPKPMRRKEKRRSYGFCLADVPEGWERKYASRTAPVFYCKSCDQVASEYSRQDFDVMQLPRTFLLRDGDKCRKLVNPCGGTLHEVLREKRVRCSFPARSSDPKPKFRSGDLELSDGKLTFTFKNYANRLAKHVIVLTPGFVVETSKSKSKYNYDDINALRIKNESNTTVLSIRLTTQDRYKMWETAISAKCRPRRRQDGEWEEEKTPDQLRMAADQLRGRISAKKGCSCPDRTCVTCCL